jgi:ADP-L-glycero-D-manno-heptose 6-epimerase
VPLATNAEAKRRNLVPLRFSDFVEADLFRSRISSDPDAFGAFSAVFHLGACSSTTEGNAAYLEDINFEYTRLLASWALSRGSRFIYASSAATYGDGTAGMDDKSDDLARLHPLNLYGRSKQDFDIHARDKGWLGRIVGLKYFNVFGPNEDHKGDMRSLVHKACQQIQSAGTVKLFRSHRPDYPDGGQKRDFLYVKDAVEMTLHFAETAPSASGLFNIGSGRAHTWLDLVNPIFAALNLTPKIEFVDMPEVLREKYQYFTQADISKLRATGYDRPVTPLPDAVRDYVLNHIVPGRRLGE